MFGITLNVIKYFYRNSLAYNRTAHTKNVHTPLLIRVCITVCFIWIVLFGKWRLHLDGFFWSWATWVPIAF